MGHFLRPGLERTHLIHLVAGFVGRVAVHPFSGGTQAYSKACRHSRGRGIPYPPHHFFSTPDREFGILMAVHLSLSSVCCCLLTPSLQNLREGKQPIGTLHLEKR
jgi:hypothetical protein